MASLVQSVTGIASGAATLTVTLPRTPAGTPSGTAPTRLIVTVFAWGDAGTAPTVSTVKLGSTSMTATTIDNWRRRTSGHHPGLPVRAAFRPVRANVGRGDRHRGHHRQRHRGDRVRVLRDARLRHAAGSVDRDFRSETAAWTTGATGTTTQVNEVAIGTYGGWDNTTWTPVGPGSPWVNTSLETSASEGGLFAEFFSGYPDPGPSRHCHVFGGLSGKHGFLGMPGSRRHFKAAPPLVQADRPARAPTPQAFSKGRASGNPGGPVRNPHPGPVFHPAVQPCRARIPQNAQNTSERVNSKRQAARSGTRTLARCSPRQCRLPAPGCRSSRCSGAAATPAPAAQSGTRSRDQGSSSGSPRSGMRCHRGNSPGRSSRAHRAPRCPTRPAVLLFTPRRGQPRPGSRPRPGAASTPPGLLPQRHPSRSRRSARRHLRWPPGSPCLAGDAPPAALALRSGTRTRVPSSSRYRPRTGTGPPDVL